MSLKNTVRSVVLGRLDQAALNHGLMLATGPGFAAPVGLTLGAENSFETVCENQQVSAAWFAQLEKELADNGYVFVNSGQEQMVYEHPDTPEVVYKTPNVWSANDGINSIVGSALTACYSGQQGYAHGAACSLYWHRTGFPILVQEKLIDVCTWKKRPTADLNIPQATTAKVQIGFSSLQQQWVVYDFDCLLPAELHPEVKELFFKTWADVIDVHAQL